ncbi:DNA alkylation repair protein [Chloroflexota bacterium]
MHDLQIQLRKLAQPKKIPIYKNFFKTGEGEYGEGDEFIGVTVPDSREVARDHVDISYADLAYIIKSKIHEDRLCALIVLINKFDKAKTEQGKRRAVDFYLKYHLYGNNWDLVDVIAPKILGPWLIHRDKSLLYDYANSSNLWERRIAIITTYHFIRQREFDDTIKISEILLNDKHDLIHKAVGWMLREMGKREQNKLVDFLNKHYKNMPRTMLRYSIERLPEQTKKGYLSKNQMFQNRNVYVYI